MKRALFFLSILLLCSGKAWAAGALVTSVSASSTDHFNVTTGSVDTTGANLLVLACGFTGSTGTPTISDSKSNTWTAAQSFDTSCSNFCQRPAVQFWYVESPAVGTGHTFTCATSGGYPGVGVLIFSGGTTSSYDQHTGAGNDNPVTSLNAGSITPTQDNEIVVTALTNSGESGGVTGVALGGSYTLQITKAQTANSHPLAMGYWIQTTATATNPAWSWTSPSTTGAAIVASFKTAGGGGGSSPPQRSLVGVGK